MAAERKAKIPSFLSDLQVSDPMALMNKFRTLAKDETDRCGTRKEDDDPNSKYSMSIANSEESAKFNRYSDIVPFNYSRVKLVSKRPEKTDYINASYVNAPGNIRRYIASQGPLDETIDDFWLMVWEQNVTVVVMLTKEVERGREKCTRYWPLRDKESLEFPSTGIKVTLESEEMNPQTSCIIRTLQISRTNISPQVDKMGAADKNDPMATLAAAATAPTETKKVFQLQFIGWPDQGVPDSPDMILKLIQKTNELQQVYNNEAQDELIRPVLVHCSAGCGRTGTFCTVDSTLALLPSNPDEKNDLVYNLVSCFREQRRTMVQTLGQYQYCYLAVLHKLMNDP